MKFKLSRKRTEAKEPQKRIFIHESDPMRHQYAEVLNQQSLRLGQVLQTTLDVYDLIKRFHQELQQFIPYHSFHYQNILTQHGLEFGQETAHAHHFPLCIENMSLGDITITRKKPFTQQELITIENAINHLLYPLRNAIHYHEAVLHSFTDPLTSLGNRAAYDKAIRREIDFAKRHHTCFSLLMIDIDHFKRINDQYGHPAGDSVLMKLGKLMTQLNRSTDPVFRYGGEEFVIILNYTSLDGAKFVAERLRQQIEHADFIYQSIKIPVTISVGITHFQADDLPEKLLKKADMALYEAKKSGRNKIFVFE